MTLEFKKWIIDDSKNWTKDQKENFLRMAKFEPGKVIQIIATNLDNWAMNFCFSKNTPVFVNPDPDSKEIFDAYLKHFEAELALIT